MRQPFGVLELSLAVTVALAPLTACSPGPCTTPAPPVDDPDAGTRPVYQSFGNPYEPGALDVHTLQIPRCRHGAPFALELHVPTPDGSYPVVVFFTGFLSDHDAYRTILRHVAGHGFVVVAPQLVQRGLPAALGIPDAEQEARWARVLLNWLDHDLAATIDRDARPDRLGLVGHSRGGKVAWYVLAGEPTRARAVAGLDPVDGRGVPGDTQPRVTQASLTYTAATLVIGAGMGSVCSPEGDNHEQFFAASPSPAWHVVATQGGHADFYDVAALPTQPASQVCPPGNDPDGTRLLTAGMLTAFFRAHLQDVGDATAWLTDVAAAPTEILVEVK